MWRIICFYLFLFPVSIYTLNCDAEPLELPIRDIQVLDNIENSYMRGVSARIGMPAQSIVFLPWAELNNTWIYDEGDEGYCDETVIWNDLICEVRRGDLFREEDSDSYTKMNNIIAAGGAPEESVYEGSELGIGNLISSGIGGTDSLKLDGTEALGNFSFGIPRLAWDHGYTMLHPLGLGSNSTYLNALRDAGQITSRVWSIFWGRMWTDNPMDGSLVLGGYDKEKLTGENYTAPLVYSDYGGSAGCWTGMKVTVTDILVNFRNGQDESIVPSNTALPCCIVPQRQLLLEAPEAFIDNFQEVTETEPTDVSYGLHWSGRLFDADNVFDGDLTFRLSSGLEIRVPNDQFLTPFVDIDRNGSRIFKNDTRELLMNGVGDQPATLGRYFLTSAYLMVNHDAGTFTLWQANPSTGSDLVRVMDEETASQCGDDGSTGVVQPSASGTPPASHPTDKGDDREGSSVSGAVIGGAVAGGVLGLALVVGGILWMLRRRRRNQATSTLDAQGHKLPGYQQGPTQEVHEPIPGTSEVHGSSQFLYELDGMTGRSD